VWGAGSFDLMGVPSSHSNNGEGTLGVTEKVHSRDQKNRTTRREE